MTVTDTAAPPAGRQGRRGFSDSWHLLYLGILAFQPLLTPGSTTADWFIAAVLGVAGAGLYAVGHLRCDRLVPVTVAFGVLGAIGVWFNGGAAVFFVYAAANAGTFAPRSRAQRWLAGLTGVLVVLIVVSPIPMPYRIAAFAFPLAFVWIVGYQVMQDAERDREAARLRVDNARIERLATLGERERIARDLHDLLGHTLTGIVVRAQLIERVATRDPSRAAREASDIEQMARDALTEVRATVSGWRHHALDTELDAARNALGAAGVDMVVEQDTGVSLSPPVEAALALAVREAVTNVVRHAAATTCKVGIVASAGHVRLTVADDGVGTARPDGSGLTGMRERITALGGSVDRRTGGGTTLTVVVPAQEVGA